MNKWQKASEVLKYITQQELNGPAKEYFQWLKKSLEDILVGVEGVKREYDYLDEYEEIGFDSTYKSIAVDEEHSFALKVPKELKGDNKTFEEFIDENFLLWELLDSRTQATAITWDYQFQRDCEEEGSW